MALGEHTQEVVRPNADQGRQVRQREQDLHSYPGSTRKRAWTAACQGWPRLG